MSNKLEIRTIKFGDEKTAYDAKSVEEISQEEQDENPTKIPNGLDLWESKVGKVLELDVKTTVL